MYVYKYVHKILRKTRLLYYYDTLFKKKKYFQFYLFKMEIISVNIFVFIEVETNVVFICSQRLTSFILEIYLQLLMLFFRDVF